VKLTKSNRRTPGAFSGALLVAALLGVAALTSVSCRGKEQTRTVEGSMFDISPATLAVTPPTEAGGADEMVNLGSLTEGEKVRYDALLRNAGTDPLVIKNVTTTCGCTSVEYDKKPIAAGETGALSFVLDTGGMMGLQMKLIDVETSAGERPYRIMVMATVDERKE